MPPKLSWQNVEDLGYELAQKHPDKDPLQVRFTELRRLVEQLDNFAADPDHHVNEQILEAIQYAWHEERDDTGGDGGYTDDDNGYAPPIAYKPDG